ncbi:MAG: lipoyl synthase [Candidatus Saganbacteria bacterium]|nr:lipoyl synthase [Candidatus Saganbacteria bacterium]
MDQERHLIRPKLAARRALRALLGDDKLYTVCEEARCPNLGECYAARTCAFLILGDRCTRRCAFCAVAGGTPLPPDPAEPQRVGEAAEKLGLNYVVITSVTRDDLPDGGAAQFAKVIGRLRMTNDELRIEVLVPDFQGDTKALKTVLEARPTVLNHNVETVPRLYPSVRPQADYRRSLQLLRRAKQARGDIYPPTKVFGERIYTKSGFMVGLGETREEVFSLLKDLFSCGCDIVTIGQYLPPSREHPPAARYVTPEEFAEYRERGASLGLKEVFAGPFVRSSYHAAEVSQCLSFRKPNGS